MYFICVAFFYIYPFIHSSLALDFSVFTAWSISPVLTLLKERYKIWLLLITKGYSIHAYHNVLTGIFFSLHLFSFIRIILLSQNEKWKQIVVNERACESNNRIKRIKMHFVVILFILHFFSSVFQRFIVNKTYLWYVNMMDIKYTFILFNNLSHRDVGEWIRAIESERERARDRKQEREMPIQHK